jgi:hypothetical protein
MNYSVETIPHFDHQFKGLRKKYRSLTDDIDGLVEQLSETPQSGTSIGHGCYKIRLAITSKGQGKSGGARVITYVRIVGETVFLLAIYDKSEQDSVSDQEVRALLAGLEG